MLGSRLARNVRAALALLTLSVFLAGCTSWHPLETPYEKALSERHPDEVKVTRDDGSKVRIYGPVVSGGSLRGRTARPGRHGTAPPFPVDTVAVPLSTVRRIETQHFDGGKTALLLLGVAAATIGIAAIVVGTTSWPTLGGLGSP